MAHLGIMVIVTIAITGIQYIIAITSIQDVMVIVNIVDIIITPIITTEVIIVDTGAIEIILVHIQSGYPLKQ